MQGVGGLRVAAWSSRMVERMLKKRTFAPIFPVAVAAALMTPVAHARPSTVAPRAQPQKKVIETRKPAAKAPRPAKPASPPPEAEAPPAPPKPDWPVNNPPSPASVVLNSSGLRIDAMNSSLLDILKQVCAKTGATIEGLNADQRIFGVYGPGQPRDVIAQLLDGTSYNVVMVGEEGKGTPLQIVLSEKAKGGAQPNAPVSAAEAEEPPYQPPVPIMQPPGVPRTPQQILQEMQQRQQQLREEQLRMQQMQQAQPQNTQPH